MLYTFGRVVVVVAMLVEDYYPGDKRWFIRLHEKGGKRHEMPVHSVLEQYLDAYLKEGGIAEAKKTPLFRSANRRTDTLTANGIQARNVLDMVLRRQKTPASGRRSVAIRSAPPGSRTTCWPRTPRS